MSFEGHLIHRCTIQRATLRQDEYRSDVRVYEDYLTDVPCRLVAQTQRQFDTVTQQWVTMSGYKLLLRPDADVGEGDRVVDVCYEDGTVEPGPFVIRATLMRRGRWARHQSLSVERVS
ncbi:MAG TPA: hypothetical protein PLQ85_11790 [Anaerolineae bacterium]|nr:hypothetical protein [Anaerolineae bacterium]